MINIKFKQMKNIFKIILSLFVAGLFLGSCAKKEKTLLSSGSAPTIGNTPASIVIDKNNINTGAVTISFTPATYSTPVAVTSQFEIARKGANFNPAVSLGNAIAGTTDVSSAFTYKELNAAFTALGLAPSEQVNIEMRLKTYASVSGQSNVGVMPSYSDVKTISVTPFEPQAAWIYAVGAFNGWTNPGNYGVVSLLENGTHITYINFPDAGRLAFLLLPDNSGSWSHKWGSNDGATLIVDGGADIKAPGVGWYRVTANVNALTISMEKFGSLGVVGTVNNWGGTADIPAVYNAPEHRFEATITCTGNDEIKFRLDSDWGNNWGGTDGVAAPGGANIAIAAAGTYLVTLDLTDPNNLTYTVTKK
jgi:hypothetical protein